MSTWLIVILIFAAVLSPIAWILPSARQRYQMHMRKVALQTGIKVRIESFELLGVKVMAVAYRWLRDADNKTVSHRFRLAHKVRLDKEQIQVRGDEFVEGWLWASPPQPPLTEAQSAALKNLLIQLPEDTLMLESGTAAITLWWRENGTPEQVEALAAQLADLKV